MWGYRGGGGVLVKANDIGMHRINVGIQGRGSSEGK